ncbi:MAG TPA: 6-phospho-beta-glucosidase [Ilumatobacteraceae bacterium]|nr:6-phospho-beta-glucosidase [Ilumatobacteraceae bacterium]
MKIAVVGGGSTYTPELVEGIARLRDEIEVDELVLCDPDPTRLEAVSGVSGRIASRRGWRGTLTATPDLAEAVDGADFVLLQLRIGGQAARHLDETIPLRCGCVGQETTGAGGFAKALRTVPVVLEIADEVRRRAATDAWIIDFTNPVGIVTRSLLDHGHRAMGLCNVAIGFQRLFASWLGVPAGDVTLGHAGLNHLTWIRSVDVGGQDVLPQLIEEHGEQLASRVDMPLRLLHSLGAIPSYYLRYFYQHDVVVAEQRGARTRAQDVAEIERQLLEIYLDPAVDTKPELLTRRGGAFYSEAAVQLLAAVWNDSGDVQVVDVRNNGALPDLPDDAIVEVPCAVNRAGASPVVSAGLHRATKGLVGSVATYERLAAEAAITGDRETAFLALLAHPLISQIKPAEQLLDDILTANAAHLPRFQE